MEDPTDDTTTEGVDEPKGLWKLILSSGILASMCCLPSVILVMFGLASVSTAAALSNTLYWGPFRPILYGITLIFITIGLTKYFRQQGICSLDEVKRQRTKVTNTSLLVLILSILTYLIFNYVILELLGIAVGLPWEEDAVWN